MQKKNERELKTKERSVFNRIDTETFVTLIKSLTLLCHFLATIVLFVWLPQPFACASAAIIIFVWLSQPSASSSAFASRRCVMR